MERPRSSSGGVTTARRQGILKKRRSLDENEVHKRCFSPDSHDFKPILKSHRRSSLEELRMRSPDLPSILKRKTSREEEPEEVGVEPQGILKRKSSTGSNTQLHVKIVDVAPCEDGVRPILKKRSSSEEQNTPDMSLGETPRPILKKKTSEEAETKKPILKTRKLSGEEEVKVTEKPILKKEKSEDSPVVLRQGRSRTSGSPEPRRPLSVAELVNNIESVRQSSSPTSPGPTTGAVPKFKVGGMVSRSSNEGRYMMNGHSLYTSER
jgi:supervillin